MNRQSGMQYPKTRHAVSPLSFVVPHALTENEVQYSIVFNMLGIDQNDIGIDVDLDKREVTVMARKATKVLHRGFFWVFGVPVDGVLADLNARFKAGVLEIEIPKRALAIGA